MLALTGKLASRLHVGRTVWVRLSSSSSSCFPPPTCPPTPPEEKKCSAIEKQKAFMEPACKIALITGGTSGIGLAIAQQLLCAGLQKAILASNSPCEGHHAVDSLNNEFGQGKAVYYDIDVNCNNQYECLIKESLDKFNRIDILVNSAGILNDKTWELEVDTNMKATVRGMVLAMKYLAKNGACSSGKGGLIINVAAVAGMLPWETAPIYTATKHGVVGLTRAFGTKYHFEDTNLRVLALCPGVTKTKEIVDVEHKSLTTTMGIDTAKDIISMPQQTAEEVGKAAVFLVKYGKSSGCYIMEGGDLSTFTFPCQKEASKCIKSFR